MYENNIKKGSDLHSRVVLALTDKTLIEKIEKQAVAFRISRSDVIKLALFEFFSRGVN